MSGCVLTEEGTMNLEDTSIKASLSIPFDGMSPDEKKRFWKTVVVSVVTCAAFGFLGGALFLSWL